MFGIISISQLLRIFQYFYEKSTLTKSKSILNPEENWKIFKNAHEPIIDRNTFETVQKMKSKGKRRASNSKHAEKIMFKVKIRQYRDELSEIESLRTSKEQFTLAVRKFMQMETLTPALLNELIEKIEVHSIEGKGKNKTQKIIIHYRFIGVIENPVKEENIVLEARQGVAVECLTA